MKARVGNPFSDRRVSVGVGARDQQAVAGRDDALGDGGDLRGGLPWAENDLWKALPDAPLVVDPGEAEVFERGLAQILKEFVLRCLRCEGAAADPLEQALELEAGHADRSRSRASKCLTRVDFRFSRAVKSPIVPRDGFIFL